MKRPRVYVDTSVIGGCLDKEFAEWSNKLLDQARCGGIVLMVSSLLVDELIDSPPNVRRILADLPEGSIMQLEMDEESDSLARAYIAAGAVGEASLDDARHVAMATVHEADVIVSWNFKHIVQYTRIRAFNAVNLREGYKSIEIRSPQEVSDL
jgi:predicted nucleic acid-binding protein